jgi:hypothetical protein
MEMNIVGEFCAAGPFVGPLNSLRRLFPRTKVVFFRLMFWFSVYAEISSFVGTILSRIQ